MPEGPEVRRYADFLESKIRGKRLACVEIYQEDIKNTARLVVMKKYLLMFQFDL